MKHTEKRIRMKIAVMCRGGNTRSVAMKMILSRYLDHSALVCGMETNDEETRTHLFSWADAIVVMQNTMIDGVPAQFHHKTYLFDVGNDVWGNPFHEELQLRIVELLNTNPVFNGARVINPEKVLKRLRDYRTKIESRTEDFAA